MADKFIKRLEKLTEEVSKINEGIGEIVYVFIYEKVTPLHLEVLSSKKLIEYAKSRCTNFEQEAKEAQLGFSSIYEILYAVQVLRNLGYTIEVENIR